MIDGVMRQMPVKKMILIWRWLLLCCMLNLGLTGCDHTASDDQVEAGQNEQEYTIHTLLNHTDDVEVVYHISSEEYSEEDVEKTMSILQKRAAFLGMESEVIREDENIVFHLPRTDDVNLILTELGKRGNLSFTLFSGEEILTNEDIERASVEESPDANGNLEFVVRLDLNEEGAKKFSEATGAHIGEVISIAYEGCVISAPVIQSQITGGACKVTGFSSYEEAAYMAECLNLGAFPCEIEEIRII